MSSGPNSTSTTGPITRTTRPVPPCAVDDCSVAVAVMRHSLSVLSFLGQGFGAADDFHDFLGDLRLPGGVGVTGELLDELVRVVGGRLHRPLPGGLLARRRIEHGREDARLDVARQPRVEPPPRAAAAARRALPGRWARSRTAGCLPERRPRTR